MADRAVARGDELPPLHGVPFTVKENIDVAGTPTTQGLKALANAYPTRDAPIVERTEEPPGRSPSAARTCPAVPCAGTARASCGARP